MRVLKLCPEDSELFGPHFEIENINFFHSHSSAFKRMWKEQGQTFWLRYLFTFQFNYEANILNMSHIIPFFDESPINPALMDFVCIGIHKNFIEPSYTSAMSFIENVFIASKYFHTLLPATLFAQNILFAQDTLFAQNTRSAFDSILGKPYPNSKIPFEVMLIACSMYSYFVTGICNLLKRWLQEVDISEKDNIDRTLYYWKPPIHWINHDWHPSCFEKYLSNHWAKNLPKMLLTCDVQNVFNAHQSKNECCSFFYTEKLNIFDLYKDKVSQSVIKPSVATCIRHSNCYIRIQHSNCCVEPYICKGNALCILTCETASRMKPKVDIKCFWKKLCVDVEYKGANKRNVSTFAESSVTGIETFLPVPQDIDKSYFVHIDLDYRNSYIKHMHKEVCKQMLTNIFCQKYGYDKFEDLKDSSQLMELFDNAQKLWSQEGYVDHILDVFCNPASNIKSFEKSLSNLNYALRSVAVGTSSIVCGHVICPSKKSLPISKRIQTINPNVKQENIKKSEKSKKAPLTDSNDKLKCGDDLTRDSEVAMKSKSITASGGNKNDCKKEVLTSMNLSFCEEVNNELKQISFNTFRQFNITEQPDVVETGNMTAVHEKTEGLLQDPLAMTDDSKANMSRESCHAHVTNLMMRANLSESKSKLRTCAFCQKEETSKKTFKRCSRCKSEKFAHHRYYCSRNCQIADWEKSHRIEHLTKVMF